MDPTYVLGFIGAGAMAEALLGGIIQNKLYRPDQVAMSDLKEDRLSYLHEKWGISTFQSNREVAENSTMIILAVKPHQVTEVLEEISQSLTSDQLVISLAAGVTIQKIAQKIPGIPIVRTMPNTPCLVGEGVVAFALGSACPMGIKEKMVELFSTVGEVVHIDEKLLDAVTGLSGSGPAYAYMFIEALSDGAVWAGLPRDVAIRLAAQTLVGAGKMVLATGEHPGVLKDKVTSPGGTTIAGIKALEEAKFRSAAMEAVIASYLRSSQASSGSQDTSKEEKLESRYRGVE